MSGQCANTQKRGSVTVLDYRRSSTPTEKTLYPRNLRWLNGHISQAHDAELTIHINGRAHIVVYGSESTYPNPLIRTWVAEYAFASASVAADYICTRARKYGIALIIANERYGTRQLF